MSNSPQSQLESIRSCAGSVAEYAGRAAMSRGTNRQDADRSAREHLSDLKGQVSRVLGLPLPACRRGYPDGQQGWEWDLQETLKQLVARAGAVLKAALRVPELPTNVEITVEGAESHSAAVNHWQHRVQLLNKVLDRLWQLTQRVDDAPASITAPSTNAVNPVQAQPAEEHNVPAGPAQEKRGGRRLKYDPKDDQKIAEAWMTKEHRTFKDLAMALGRKPKEVKLAFERHRKRLRRKK